MCSPPGGASEVRALVVKGSKVVMASANDGGRHEQDHDQRADGAERIAAHEEEDGADPAVDIGSRPRQLGIVIDDRHVLPHSSYLMRGSSTTYIMSTKKFTNTTMTAMNITRFCTIG